jgi:predicted MPP superfamily phosphohydrolase
VKTLSRRAFLGSALAAGAGTAATLGYYDINSDWGTGDIKLERVTVAIKDLPSAFEGYSIGFVTDIHLGIWVPQSWIISALTALHDAAVDLLILGGDYLFLTDTTLWKALGLIRNSEFMGYRKRETIGRIYTRLGELLSQFTFPDGIIGVAGNHDHWNSTSLFHSVLGSFPHLKLLVNETFHITRKEQLIVVFGCDDFLTGVPKLPPPSFYTSPAARILVSHNPDYISYVVGNNLASFDLALCGHTHGGQIRLPGIGPLLRQVEDSRFVSGLVPTPQGLVYTSRGLGVVGLPFRMMCPPEVTIFTLRKE